MSYIPLDELATLKSAAQAKAVADDVKQYTDEMVAAYLINSAANTGEHSVIWQHNMSSVLKSTLEAQSYRVTRVSPSAYPDRLWEISGF